jgi:hypothetical protein
LISERFCNSIKGFVWAKEKTEKAKMKHRKRSQDLDVFITCSLNNNKTFVQYKTYEDSIFCLYFMRLEHIVKMIYYDLFSGMKIPHCIRLSLRICITPP